MSDTRPLPFNPNLEFERKAAKELLRELRAGHEQALVRARAWHDGISAADPLRVKLADAQLVIAREYGFASWPKLVRYFGDSAKQRHSSLTALGWRRMIAAPDQLHQSVDRLLREHRTRGEVAGRAFAAYVPRLYGLSLDEAFSSEVTPDDARLALARMEGFDNWEALLQEAEACQLISQQDPWHIHEFHEAWRAIKAGDLRALQQVVAERPGLLEPDPARGTGAQRMLVFALSEREDLEQGVPEEIIAWLLSQGADLQAAIDPMLLGRPFSAVRINRLQWLLDQGANPNWVAPNGLSVLEHALLRVWNMEAVDLLATRAKRRDAMWIAAGLGDVAGVARWFDARGRLSPEARRDRPDFLAVTRGAYPRIVEPSDDELLREVFYVATINGRTEVMRHLVDRGVDVNSRWWEIPFLVLAVLEGRTQSVEALIACGADPDVSNWRQPQSARELARDEWLRRPRPAYRRIVELMGLDGDALLAEREATPAPEPAMTRRMEEYLALASDDARRRGDAAVGLEHFFFGMLRAQHGPESLVKAHSGMNLRAFVAECTDRLLPHHDRLDAPLLPHAAEVESVFAQARDLARAARREQVDGSHLLRVLVRTDDGPVAQLLHRFEADLPALRRLLERGG